MSNLTTYHIFVSCSSDLEEEINIINKIIDKFNVQEANKYQVKLETWQHKKNAQSRMGEGVPQQVIDDYIKKFDAEVYKGIYLGMIWKRYGLPVAENDSRSGTKYEYEKFKELKDNKKVLTMKFFVKKVEENISPTDDQYSKSVDFIKLIEADGYVKYFNEGNFEEIIENELKTALIEIIVPYNINSSTKKRLEKIDLGSKFFEAKHDNNSRSYLDIARSSMTVYSSKKYLILRGMAGVGKSYLATRLLYDFYSPSKKNLNLFNPDWIWWIDANSQKNSKRIANELKILAKYLERVGELRRAESRDIFVSTKMQRHDQTVETTDRPSVGRNFAFL